MPESELNNGYFLNLLLLHVTIFHFILGILIIYFNFRLLTPVLRLSFILDYLILISSLILD